MLLCIDLGNSNITLGLFADGRLLHTFRLQSRREQTSDEYATALVSLLELRACARSQVEHAVIASVVPQLVGVLSRAVQCAFGCSALVVTSATDVGLVLDVERPSEVGIDRIVNVAAARQLALREAGLDPHAAGAVLGAGAIVVDLGTATTYDCITADGRFLGGVIQPGVRTSAETLTRKTSMLPATGRVLPLF